MSIPRRNDMQQKTKSEPVFIRNVTLVTWNDLVRSCPLHQRLFLFIYKSVLLLLSSSASTKGGAQEESPISHFVSPAWNRSTHIEGQNFTIVLCSWSLPPSIPATTHPQQKLKASLCDWPTHLQMDGHLSSGILQIVRVTLTCWTTIYRLMNKFDLRVNWI